MTPKAIFLGSIGTLAETSEIQRHAFNAAFAEAGLHWTWSPAEYRELLARPGGARRIADYAAGRGDDVNVEKLHRRKSEIFQRMLEEIHVPPRPGLIDLIAAARGAGVKLALVTTTSRENVAAMLRATGLEADDFDFISDRTTVEESKPAPDAYRAALDALGLEPADAMAIEDTPESAEAAIAAGIRCVAFPGAAHVGRRFGQVLEQVDVLAPRTFGLPQEEARSA